MADNLDLTDLQSSIGQLTNTIASLEPVLKKMGQRTTEQETAASDLTSATKYLRDQVVIARDAYTKQTGEVRNLNSLLGSYRNTLHEISMLARAELTQNDLKVKSIKAELALSQERLNLQKQETGYIQQNLDRLKSTITQNQEERKSVSALLDVRKQLIDATKAQLNDTKKEQTTVASRIDALTEHRDSIKSELQTTAVKITDIKDNITELTNNPEQSLADRAAATERINRLVLLNESYSSEISLLDQALTQVRTKYKNGQKMSAVDESLIAEYEAMRESAKSYRTANEASIDSEIEHKQSLATQMDRLIAEQAQLEAHTGMLTSELEKNTDALAAARLDWFDLSDGVTSSTKQLGELATAQDQLNTIYDEYTSDISDLTRAATAEAQSLKQAKEKQDELNNTIAEQTATLKAAQLERLKIFADVSLKLATKVNEYAKVLGDLVAEIRRTQQQFGIAAGQAAQLKIGNLVESISSGFNTLTSLGKTAAVSAAEVQATRADFQSQFGGVLTAKAAADLAIQAKELGVTTKDLADARRVFMTSSMGNLADAKIAEGKFISIFKQQGLTNKDAMIAIAQYSELYARNGTRFAESFTRAAADAKKIGVDLGKVDQIGDSIIGDFEGFLEKTSELGAMGFNLDTNVLAQLAESGDTGALMNELRSQLSATGKDITNLRRSEQLALSNTFGISMEMLQRLSGATAGSGEELTDQQKTNSFLERLVNITEVVSGIMARVLSTIAFIHTRLLGAIAANTAKTAMTAAGTGIGAAAGMSRMGTALALGGGAVAGIGGGMGIGTALGASTGESAIGTGIGTILGGGIGFALGGPLGASIGMAIGGNLGGAAAGAIAAGDDVISQAGYGERSLVTPTGVIALNNQDNIISYADDMVSTNTGLQLLSKGSIAESARSNATQQVNVDMSALENKLDQVVRAISGMHVSMDSTKVGKVLINNSDTAGSVGVMGIQNLQTF
jgi:hypothetical protein